MKEKLVRELVADIERVPLEVVLQGYLAIDHSIFEKLRARVSVEYEGLFSDAEDHALEIADGDVLSHHENLAFEQERLRVMVASLDVCCDRYL